MVSEPIQLRYSRCCSKLVQAAFGCRFIHIHVRKFIYQPDCYRAITSGFVYLAYPYHYDTAFSQTVSVDGDSLLPYPYSNVYHCTYIDTSKHCGSATVTTHVVIKQTPIQDICVVTLDSTLSYNMLVWDKAQPTDTVTSALIDSFFIMRGSQQISSQPYSAYSTYTDYNADISL